MVKKETVLDLLFPRRCAVCDEIVDHPGLLICRKCKNRIMYIKEPCCMKCGRQLKENATEYCSGCTDHNHYYLQGTALYDYGSMSDSIYRFKYKGRKEYAEFYGRELFREKESLIRKWKPDALVPVPVHISRRRERGYNQSELIAYEFSRHIHIPVADRLIIRTKKTVPQKNLGERERQNNLKRAFNISQNDVKLSTIVIIDDIYTTGSTVNAMTDVLVHAGIKNIYFMALAIGRE